MCSMVASPASPVGPTTIQTVTPPAGIETSAAFNQWLGVVPNGSIINLTGVAIDAEEGPIIVEDRHDLVFIGGTVTQRTDGTGVAPKTWVPRLHLNWPRNRCGWLVIDSTRVAWYGTRFDGCNTNAAYLGQNYEEQAAWSLRRSRDIDLVGVTASGAWGDGVSIVHDDNDTTRAPCERVRLLGVTLTNVGRNFVAVVCGTDILVSGVTADGSGRSAFNVEPAVEANRTERVEISNVSASRVTGVLIAHKGGSNRVSDICWRDMRITDKPVSVTIEGRTDRPGRRSGYLIERISGGGPSIANGIAMTIRTVDDVTVRDVWQRVAGYLTDGSGKVIYPGVGMDLVGVNGVRIERAEFPKGKSAAATGDVTPVRYMNCTGVTVT